MTQITKFKSPHALILNLKYYRSCSMLYAVVSDVCPIFGIFLVCFATRLLTILQLLFCNFNSISTYFVGYFIEIFVFNEKRRSNINRAIKCQ